MTASLVRVLLVDDHKVIRLGLRSLFETVADVHVVGEAGTVAEAMAAVRLVQPDAVIMDVLLPDGSGADACRAILAERPETRVIMLTSHPEEELLVSAVMAGAAGYVLKQADPEQVVEAVARATRGESLLDPASTRAALEWIRRANSTGEGDPIGALSELERQILPLIAAGKTNREIAAALDLSDQTIKGHVSAILHKLRLSRRAEAAAFAVKHQAAIERSVAAVPPPSTTAA